MPLRHVSHMDVRTGEDTERAALVSGLLRGHKRWVVRWGPGGPPFALCRVVDGILH